MQTELRLPDLRAVAVNRYITPLREGGSLPAIVGADDGFQYVLKFRGAGQGVKALIAELIGGQLAKALGLKIPELVFADVDPAFGRTEPDEEIQDLLKASKGLNLALHYLSGAITYDANVAQPDALTASLIVWLDSLITNVDRTARNTNMLLWHEELWLIDHGAALYFHHNWDDWQTHAQKPFLAIKDHVLLPFATDLAAAHEAAIQKITPELIAAIVQQIPDDWLTTAVPIPTAESRMVYEQYLLDRLTLSPSFQTTAHHAR